MAMKIMATDKKFGTMSKKAERMAVEKNPMHISFIPSDLSDSMPEGMPPNPIAAAKTKESSPTVVFDN